MCSRDHKLEKGHAAPAETQRAGFVLNMVEHMSFVAPKNIATQGSPKWDAPPPRCSDWTVVDCLSLPFLRQHMLDVTALRQPYDVHSLKAKMRRRRVRWFPLRLQGCCRPGRFIKACSPILKASDMSLRVHRSCVVWVKRVAW